ncbi:MAG: outer membrane beta-barrel family protein [Tannerellaceae bacterium]
MKLSLFLLFTSLFLGQQLSAQSVADTTLLLQNINIQGQRFAGLSGRSIKRLQVEGNLSSLTSTTAEALRQLPSVITDIEGGLTFRGSNKPGFFINGVPYGLLEEYSGDVLIQLPALFFNRIAMTSVPPLSLVPDGDAGVLNLSSTTFGTTDSPLQVTLGGGLQERYNAGAVLNLHPGKFHITAKYNYRHEYRERSFQKTTTDKTGTAMMNNNASARPNVHLADLTVGYDLSPRDLLTVYGLYHVMDYNRYGGINNTKLKPSGEVANRMLRHRYNTQSQEAYAAEARWNHRFAQPGDRLEVLFNYNNFAYDEDNQYKNEKPETGKILAEDNLHVHQNKNNYYLSASYTKLFAHAWRLQAGYIGRVRNEEYVATANNLKDGQWVPNPKKSNDYTFDRYTNLLFAGLERRFGLFTAEVGLQGEHSLQRVAGVESNRFHLYPQARVSYDMASAGNLAFSYMQRAIRPYGMDLNPFVDNSDATYIRQGNPELQDEFVHSLELSYLLTAHRFRFSPSLYFRSKSNRIVDMAFQENNQTIWQKQNMGNSHTVGFELSANWTPLSLLSIGLSGDVYRDEIDGRTIGYDVKKSLTCWDVKGNVNVNITPTTEFQVDAFYLSDQLTPQGKIGSRYTVNAGLSQYFFHRSLRANLSVSNLFDSLKETTTIDTESLHLLQVRNRDARVTWLTLTYSL